MTTTKAPVGGPHVDSTVACPSELMACLGAARSIDDRVMGGRSSSGMSAGSQGSFVFHGTVRLDNGGGFASVRGPLPGGVLSDADGVALEVIGDGRSYQIRFGVTYLPEDVVYKCSLATLPGKRQRLQVRFSEFEGSCRGRRVNVPPLQGSEIVSLGLLIGERQCGDFRLELLSIAPLALGERG